MPGVFRLPRNFLLLLSLLLLTASQMLTIAAADDKIYSWTDGSGKRHFSTSPSNTKAKATSLPRLEKEDLDGRIDKIKSETPINCGQHGGVDCDAGADSDGSVICLDGFRSAVLPFRFSCLEARVKSEMLLFYDEAEVGVRHSVSTARANSRRKLREIRINVRNDSAVAAFGLEVSLEVPGRQKMIRKLDGPAKVEPYGLADYTMSFGTELPVTVYQVSGLKHRVRCENCR